jgi:hypothetical protein
MFFDRASQWKWFTLAQRRKEKRTAGCHVNKCLKMDDKDKPGWMFRLPEALPLNLITILFIPSIMLIVHRTSMAT